MLPISKTNLDILKPLVEKLLQRLSMKLRFVLLNRIKSVKLVRLMQRKMHVFVQVKLTQRPFKVKMLQRLRLQTQRLQDVRLRLKHYVRLTQLKRLLRLVLCKRLMLLKKKPKLLVLNVNVLLKQPM